MIEEEKLKSVWNGVIKIGTLTMKFHVLNNGERVIEEQSVIDFMNWMESGEITNEMAEDFARQLKSF